MVYRFAAARSDINLCREHIGALDSFDNHRRRQRYHWAHLLGSPVQIADFSAARPIAFLGRLSYGNNEERKSRMRARFQTAAIERCTGARRWLASTVCRRTAGRACLLRRRELRTCHEISPPIQWHCGGSESGGRITSLHSEGDCCRTGPRRP
jgi:hypothetical protein